MRKQYKQTQSREFEMTRDEVVRAIRAYMYDKNEILTPETTVSINKDGSCSISVVDHTETTKTEEVKI